MAATSFFDTAFGADSSFAELDRISAEMERQAAVMMRQATQMQSSPDAAVQQAALAGAPAGATSVTMVSTSNGKGVCTQSVRVTAMGEGKAPQVIRKVSGDCAAGAAPATTGHSDRRRRRPSGHRPPTTASDCRDIARPGARRCVRPFRAGRKRIVGRMSTAPAPAPLVIPRSLFLFSLFYGGMVCMAGILGVKQVALGPLAVEAGIFAFLLLVALGSAVAELLRPGDRHTSWCASASCR